MARARQTIRIRVNKGSGNGSYKMCDTCGGIGVVPGPGLKTRRVRKAK